MTYDSTFYHAAFERYSGLSLPIGVICAKYNLTVLMSASRTGLPSSADSTYYLCRDNIDEVYYLYESQGMLHGGNVIDDEPKELTQQEATLWVLSHSSIDALIAALRHFVSANANTAADDAVSDDAGTPNDFGFTTLEDDDDLFDAFGVDRNTAADSAEDP